MQELMTPEQVARYLQLTTDTVYRLIRQKKLAASKIGRAYRIPKQDLDEFLLAHSTREEVRRTLFRRVMSIGERNPDQDADTLLASLEQHDQAARSRSR